MNYQWHRQAEKELIQMAEYCVKEFGKKVADDFLNNIDRQVHLIVAFPEMGKVEPLLEGRQREYRSLVIHELFKLVYYINERKQRIVIADLWDTRREPATLSRRIRGK
ncbi:type II toxin-antitoxin system RelE/ParE family toxin [Bacteroides sp.]